MSFKTVELQYLQQEKKFSFAKNIYLILQANTVQKVFVFGVFLVGIFPHLENRGQENYENEHISRSESSLWVKQGFKKLCGFKSTNLK